MAGQMGRRRVHKRKPAGKQTQNRLTLAVVLLILAVFLGFLTARFVIGPLIGYNAEESPIQIAKSGETEKEKEQDAEKKDTKKEASSEKEANAEAAADESQDVKDGEENPSAEAKSDQISQTPEDGFALQFGAFSTKDSAQKLADELKAKGIDTKIIKADDVYKVISPIIDQRADAQKALEELQEQEVTDVFIASFQ